MTSTFDVIGIVTFVVLALVLLACSAGVVIAARLRQMSPGVNLVLAGFAGGAVETGAYLLLRIAMAWMTDVDPFGPLQLLGYIFIHALGMVSLLLVVFGVARVLRDYRDRLARLREACADVYDDL